MSLFTWCARRLGGLAMICLCLFSYWVISRESAAARYRITAADSHDGLDATPATPASPNGAGIWTILFSCYCLLVHVLAFSFPLRACWAIWDITTSLRKTVQSEVPSDLRPDHGRHSSSKSLSSLKAPIMSYTTTNPCSEAGNVDAESTSISDTTIDTQDQVIHAIVIPSYKEETDTLRETLDVLSSHTHARGSYDVRICPPMIKRPRKILS